MKVYGIRENKSHEELPLLYGISKTEVYEAPKSGYVKVLSLPETNTRHVLKNWSKVDYLIEEIDFPDNYNFQVVFQQKKPFVETAKPAGIIQVYSKNDYVNILNYITPPGFKLSDYNVVHFNIFWDGLHLCCECKGYVE